MGTDLWILADGITRVSFDGRSARRCGIVAIAGAMGGETGFTDVDFLVHRARDGRGGPGSSAGRGTAHTSSPSVDEGGEGLLRWTVVCARETGPMAPCCEDLSVPGG